MRWRCSSCECKTVFFFFPKPRPKWLSVTTSKFGGVTTWKYSSNYKWIYHHRYGGHIAIYDGVQPSLYPFCSPQLHSEGVTHLQMTYLYYSCIYRSWKCQFPIWRFPQMGVPLNHPAGVPPLWKAPLGGLTGQLPLSSVGIRWPLFIPLGCHHPAIDFGKPPFTGHLRNFNWRYRFHIFLAYTVYKA